MKLLKFLFELPIRFILALFGFTFFGWIGRLGIVLVLLRSFGVIHWPWWVAALPLEYGVIYCAYMIVDGALYGAGLKDVGKYARFTQAPLVAQHEQSKIQGIIAEGPERIGMTIDAWSEDPNRRRLAQALLDAALGRYSLATKDEAKNLDQMINDGDKDGISAEYKQGVLAVIKPGETVYVVDIGWDGVDTLRYHGQVWYAPNHEVHMIIYGNQ